MTMFIWLSFRTFKVLICLTLVGCTSTRPLQPITDPNNLSGSWVLETVNGRPPKTVNIASWRISFATNRHWTFGGEMAGRFQGMQINGSGSWDIESGILQWVAENRKGQSKATIQGAILTLSPDPVITPGGKSPAVTTYRRVGK